MAQQDMPNFQARRLILIRRSRPEVDENIRPAEWPLSEAGHQAALKLGLELKAREILADSIISSPEAKAVQTAEAVATSLNTDISIQVDKDVAEHGSQRTVFRSSKDFEADVLKLFTADPTDMVFGDETADAAVTRFADAVRKGYRLSAGDLIVVTHGRVLSFS